MSPKALMFEQQIAWTERLVRHLDLSKEDLAKHLSWLKWAKPRVIEMRYEKVSTFDSTYKKNSKKPFTRISFNLDI